MDDLQNFRRDPVFWELSSPVPHDGIFKMGKGRMAELLHLQDQIDYDLQRGRQKPGNSGTVYYVYTYYIYIFIYLYIYTYV